MTYTLPFYGSFYDTVIGKSLVALGTNQHLEHVGEQKCSGN